MTFINMRIVAVLLIFFLNLHASASENSGGNMPDHEWSFEGITGTFDKAALQRGFKISINALFFASTVPKEASICLWFDSKKVF